MSEIQAMLFTGQPKDFSSLPGVVESKAPKLVKTIVTAQTDNNMISYEGRSSNVSSGGFWGGCQHLDGENPASFIRRIAAEHNDWLRTYENPDTGEIYRIAMRFDTRIFIDGKEISADCSEELGKFSR